MLTGANTFTGPVEIDRGSIYLPVPQAFPGGNALVRARQIYHLLGMSGTREDTAVLLYVALSDRKAAVFAGSGIHADGSSRAPGQRDREGPGPASEVEGRVEIAPGERPEQGAVHRSEHPLLQERPVVGLRAAIEPRHVP